MKSPTKQQIENNKLIAEFMGGEHLDYAHDEDMILSYHNSWSWLMPSVSKCYDNSGLADGKDNNVVGDITHNLLDVDITETHKAVVEFIKWYNENKEDLLHVEARAVR